MACRSYVCPSPAITGSHMTACTFWAYIVKIVSIHRVDKRANLSGVNIQSVRDAISNDQISKDISHTNCSCLPQGHRGSVMVACTSQGFAVMCCCCIARLCLTLVKGQLRRFAKTPMARACSLLDTACVLLTGACSLLGAVCFVSQATTSVQPRDVAWICKVDIIDNAASLGCSVSWPSTGLLS